jgi:hypothetical protein
VSQAGKPDIQSQTGTDGTATLKLAQGGTYEITIVPRNEYLGGAELSKLVIVADNSQASVEFTLRRASLSTEPPFDPIYR